MPATHLSTSVNDYKLSNTGGATEHDEEPHEDPFLRAFRQQRRAREMEEFPVRKRFAVIGARGVGKTAISRRCTTGQFDRDIYCPTFEDMYEWRETFDSVNYDICILDTAGVDAYSLLGLHYTIGVDGYALVFSLRDMATFRLIQLINQKLLNTLNAIETKGTLEIPRVLVGNFCDSVPPDSPASLAAKEYAKQNYIPFIETSADTGHNVCEVFTELVRIVRHNLHVQHCTSTEHRDGYRMNRMKRIRSNKGDDNDDNINNNMNNNNEEESRDNDVGDDGSSYRYNEAGRSGVEETESGNATVVSGNDSSNLSVMVTHPDENEANHSRTCTVV